MTKTTKTDYTNDNAKQTSGLARAIADAIRAVDAERSAQFARERWQELQERFRSSPARAVAPIYALDPADLFGDEAARARAHAELDRLFSDHHEGGSWWLTVWARPDAPRPHGQAPGRDHDAMRADGCPYTAAWWSASGSQAWNFLDAHEPREVTEPLRSFAHRVVAIVPDGHRVLVRDGHGWREFDLQPGRDEHARLQKIAADAAAARASDEKKQLAARNLLALHPDLLLELAQRAGLVDDEGKPIAK